MRSRRFFVEFSGAILFLGGTAFFMPFKVLTLKVGNCYRIDFKKLFSVTVYHQSASRLILPQFCKKNISATDTNN